MPLPDRTAYPIRFLLKNRAIRYRLFRGYLSVRFFLILALNLQTTIIGYWVYDLTHKVESVGLLGLFEAIPAIGFSFISGHIVDQREKRGIIRACIIAYLALGVGFTVLSMSRSAAYLGIPSVVRLIYAGIFVGGALRAFVSPATFALLGLLLPRKLYANAGTWSSMSWQAGAILGPLLAGLLIALCGVHWSFAVAAGFVLIAFVAVLRIPPQAIIKKEREPMLTGLREGLRFIFQTQIVRAVLLLDMFAVLFGGATALLPAYAKDILKVNEVGFGWLRAAPGFGAMIMFLALANKPLKTAPGPKLLLCVAAFGGSLIVFGISKIFWLSMLALALSGAFDAVSVVIRSTILQLYTPDAMRGRVSAVNTMFVSSSNELGEVESGYTAKWMGTIPSVVFGGCMTMLIAGLTFLTAPKVRRLTLEGPEAK